GTGTANGTGKGAALASTTYVFPTDRQMGAYWVPKCSWPKVFIGATFTASWNTWVHLTPDEWGHRRGWGKRFGVAYLDNSMTQPSLVLLPLAMNQDPMYYRCDCSGAWARTRHAIKMSFMSRNHKLTSTPCLPRVECASWWDALAGMSTTIRTAAMTASVSTAPAPRRGANQNQPLHW